MKSVLLFLAVALVGGFIKAGMREGLRAVRTPATMSESDMDLVSARFNKQLPKKIDNFSTLVKTSYSSSVFTYHYTLQLNREQFMTALPNAKANFIKEVCSSIFKTLPRSEPIHIKYLFNGQNGEELGYFHVVKKDCF